MRVSEYSWYIWFWLSVGSVAVAPIYVLLYLIWRAVSR